MLWHIWSIEYKLKCKYFSSNIAILINITVNRLEVAVIEYPKQMIL